MIRYFLLFALLAGPSLFSQNSLLKYIVYDFDGLDIGQTALPDGDYHNNDMTASVVSNPLQPSDVLGDRVLKLDLSWQAGVGEFGKATMRYLDLNAGADKLNFYFYNPSSNSGSAELQVVILEDDNSDDVYSGASDDKWTHNVSIPRSGAWQLVSVPLSSFSDANSGGNGSFDARYASPGGMLFSVGFNFSKPAAAQGSDHYFMDMIAFSEGDLPTGSGILDLPPAKPGGECALGALSSGNPANVPSSIEGILPPGKKLALVNWFLYYSSSGTNPDAFPGPEVQTLLDNGYTPIITWESMFSQYDRLDGVQPKLDQIINGTYDSYYNAFAAKIKSYSGTVILRILHEFEGDWYSWSLAHNGQDPEKYKAAFRHIVDRFRANGANNIQWMWCLNAEPKPYSGFNNVVSCYPGDSYVDIVATDIYNHPNLGTPDWKSFRYTMAESYYYLAKHFSHRPIFVCEVGSRERNGSEPSGSQSKADWTCMMSKDLKSYFSLTKALVYFNLVKEHDWRINSTEAAKQGFVSCIWSDDYFGGVVSVNEHSGDAEFFAYPNPFSDEVWLHLAGKADTGSQVSIKIFDVSGKVVYSKSSEHLPPSIHSLGDLAPGVYVIEMRSGSMVKRQRIIRSYDR
jgi:hypothetical protein